jgi:hypothetical protein
MATVTRINGSKTNTGVIYNPNSNLYVIAVKTAATAAVNLQNEDSNGGNAVIGGVIEAIVDEINPLAWFTPSDASGLIYAVMDKAINSAPELQTRIRNIGLLSNGTTSIGPNSVDISGTTVTPATSFTVA